MNILNLAQELNNKIKPFYMICGNDSYYRKLALKQFESLVDSQTVDFNLTYCASSCSVDELLIALSTPPFLSDYRLVIWQSDGKKIDKDKTKQLEEKLKQWINNPCPDVVLLALNEGDTFKPFLKISEIVDCSQQDTSVLLNVVMEMITKRGFKAETQLVREIIVRCNNDMATISSELEKLFCYVQNNVITADDVENVVINNVEQDVFKLTDNIASGNYDMAYSLLNNLLLKGEQPQKLLALITSQYRRMFVVKVSKDSDDILASQLGIKPYAISKLQKTAVKYKPMQLKKLTDKLQLIEYQAKSGQIGMTEGLNLAMTYVTDRR